MNPILAIGLAGGALYAIELRERQRLADIAAREIERMRNIGEVASGDYTPERARCNELLTTHKLEWWEASAMRDVWLGVKCPADNTTPACVEAREYAACVDARDEAEGKAALDRIISGENLQVVTDVLFAIPRALADAARKAASDAASRVLWIGLAFGIGYFVLVRRA